MLYGSQSGTAQEVSPPRPGGSGSLPLHQVAERVAREGSRYHFSVQVSAMDSFSLSTLPLQPLVVYVCSTTGQVLDTSLTCLSPRSLG